MIFRMNGAPWLVGRLGPCGCVNSKRRQMWMREQMGKSLKGGKKGKYEERVDV